MMKRRPQSPTSRQESEMATRSLRELESAGSSNDPIDRLRLVCLGRGATGILELGRVFRLMDHEGTRKLNQEQFATGLRQMNLEISDKEIDELFKKFDPDNDGSIKMKEFLLRIRPPIPDGRLTIIDKAFNKIDKDGDGVVSIADLKHMYSVLSQPRYIAGEDSEESILVKFLDHFEQDGHGYGEVTREEFLNYYAAISASIDNDCYFDLMMRQAYKL